MCSPVIFSRIAPLAVLLLTGLVGCGESPEPGVSRPRPPTPNSAASPLSWPLIVPELRADVLVPPLSDGTFPRQVTVLSRRDPVRGSCWPAAQNGILRRWLGAGVASPAEKYAQLFLDPTVAAEFAAWLVAHHGHDTPYGADAGICPGWASAVAAEEPPRKPMFVRRAGQGTETYLTRCREVEAARPRSGCIRFAPGDVMALLAELYSDAPALFAGARCAQAEVGYGGVGRVDTSGCQVDAGQFFLALTNYVGRHRRPLVMTMTTGPVWARPIYGYRVLAYEPLRSALGNPAQVGGARRVQLSVLVGGTADAALGSLGHDEMLFDIQLTLDEKGQVTGGAWLDEGKDGRPGATYLPAGPGTRAPGLSSRNVRALLSASQ